MYKRNEELYDFLVNNYCAGKISRRGVCEKFNLNENTLQSFLFYHGLKKNKDYNAIIEDFKKGISVKDLAELHNVSKTTVYKLIKE